MKNIFYSDKEIINHYCKYIINDKYKYLSIVGALKLLGDFDNKIELFCEDEEKEEVYVVDKNGIKFSFILWSFNDKKRNQIKKYMGNSFTTYSCYKFNKLSRTRLYKNNEGYELENGYTICINKNETHPKRYTLEKSNLSYWFSTPASVKVNENLLINEIAKKDKISFYEFFCILKENFDVSSAEFVNLGVTKYNQKVGRIYISEGKIIAFDINEEKDIIDFEIVNRIDEDLETEFNRKLSKETMK